jgi:signal transduction histidine kinase
VAVRVLCIEKDESLQARIRALLEASGFVVETSGSGLDGIARALASPPDLVLAGVRLPDLEGYELAARLRRERSLATVPIVAMGDTGEERDVALAAGANGFLSRAVDGRLGDELRAFLGGKRDQLPEQGEREALRTMSGIMAARLESALVGERDACRRLAEHDRLKSAFMHNLAHELSTPLTPLAGYLRILQADKLGELAPQQKRIVDAMMHSVGRLARIVDNLSDFASLQAGQAPILEASVQPDRLADDVVAEQRSAVKDARLHLAVQHAGGPAVLADARKLRQALANLVGNAVKFSPHGGEVLVEVSREEGKLRYAVYDQGPGVRPGEQDRIFEPLYHAAARGNDEARLPGSGLGLPVARRLAEAHGGRVAVESPPRTQPTGSTHHFTGAKFLLEIPARSAEAPPASDASGGAAVAG